MTVTVGTVTQWIEEIAPPRLAMEGDPIGLEIGTLNREVEKVLITLDLTEEVVDEAIENGVQLIIAHHPLLFRPLRKIDPARGTGKLVARLLKHDIAVYAAHTNLDIAPGGLNDWLAEQLSLRNCKVLHTTQHETLKKLIVYVPVDHEEKLRQALGDAGAGYIGEYSHCTFRSKGIGTFKPGDTATPFIGERGRIEQVDELKIETLYPAYLEKSVLKAMFAAHPYEEVAYDIYTLDQPGTAYGLGRIGTLTEEVSLDEFASIVKEKLDVPFCRIVGSAKTRVKKVAILGGDGNKYVHEAIKLGADVLVTGDIYYHTAQDALAAGLALIDPGHHAEKIMIKGLRKILSDKANQHGSKIEIIASKVDTNPFRVA